MVRRSRAGAQHPRASRRRHSKQSTPAAPVTLNNGFVALRIPSRDIPLQTGKPEINMERAAMEWTYVVRSRQRWATTEGAATQQARAAADLLRRLGVDSQALAEIARSGIVEVATRWLGSEEQQWAARVLPWEYVLAGATSNLRGRDQSLTVVRYLDRGDKAAPKRPMKQVLFVASEPGVLRGLYEFDTEREIVRTHLQVRSSNWHELDSPTAFKLSATIAEVKPDVVHLAGIDTHQARAIIRNMGRRTADYSDPELPETIGTDERSDGYVLAGPQGIHHVHSEELSNILAANNHRPRLVALSLRNSAARIAPIAVARGAWAAIGFQDNFEDELAELFFSVLYSRLGRSGWGLTAAFRSAWERVRRQPGHRQGSGVVLWSATPNLPAPGKGAIHASDQYGQRAEQLSKEEDVPLDPAKVKPGDVQKWIAVKVKPFEDLNYSILHNRRSLFDQFILSCPNPRSRTLQNIRVKVSLYAGAETAVFDRILNLQPPFLDMQDIHVPLTSTITRSVHESVRTSLFVEVSWGHHVLYRETFSVRLTPVDQWRDSDTDRKWLPSFVFPRDPAVTQIVESAQRYVRVLRDDPAAGFDGYQSYDTTRADPSADVDLQVQAIWSAIVHELQLGYINPPPGYSSELDSQRLRTPSMVAGNHAGTCIDLALFFAACLELIDIYPVIFLLEGHAFPGYWRWSEDHASFREARPERIHEIVQADSRTSTIAGAQREPWFLGKQTYREIVQLVNAGKLVPIETVRLTENCGLGEAIEAGRDNLHDEQEFAAMIDITLAREEQVTPLPILGASA